MFFEKIDRLYKMTFFPLNSICDSRFIGSLPFLQYQRLMLRDYWETLTFSHPSSKFNNLIRYAVTCVFCLAIRIQVSGNCFHSRIFLSRVMSTVIHDTHFPSLDGNICDSRKFFERVTLRERFTRNNLVSRRLILRQSTRHEQEECGGLSSVVATDPRKSSTLTTAITAKHTLRIGRKKKRWARVARRKEVEKKFSSILKMELENALSHYLLIHLYFFLRGHEYNVIIIISN